MLVKQCLSWWSNVQVASDENKTNEFLSCFKSPNSMPDWFEVMMLSVSVTEK